MRSFQTPRHFAHLGLAAEFAFGADFAGDAGDFRGEHAELLDHGIDDGRRTQKFALQRPAVDIELTVCSRSPLATAAIARVTSAVGHNRSSIKVLTEASISPQAPREPESHALAGLAFPADDLADALELLGHALVGRRRFH